MSEAERSDLCSSLLSLNQEILIGFKKMAFTRDQQFFPHPSIFPSLESMICPKLPLLKLHNLYSVSKWGESMGSPRSLPNAPSVINPAAEI